MTTAVAHPNIAIVKYWGKSDQAGNVPASPSLSITLNQLTTTTRIATAKHKDVIRLNGTPVEDQKILQFLGTLRDHAEVPPVEVDTSNNFPTGAGLASSASGFAALITALDAHYQLQMTETERSQWARRGSASAARSIFGGIVALSGPAWAGEQLLAATTWPLQVFVAITANEQKAVSSTVGMQTSRATSPFFTDWLTSTHDDFDAAKQAIENRDFLQLAQIGEHSCMKMHAVMLSSQPPLTYWNAGTLAAIATVRKLQDDGKRVFLTIDAGPQVKVVAHNEDPEPIFAALSATDGVTDVIRTSLGDGARIVDG